MTTGFIIGNPRSGTSVLRLMLNAHSQLVAPPESGFLQWWYEKYSSWNTADSQNPDKVAAFVADLLSSKKIEGWALDSGDLEQLIIRRKPAGYSELIQLPYEAYAKKQTKRPKVILDKNNYYVHYLDSISQVWTDARFVFIIRDGRDVAASYKQVNRLESQSPYRPDLPDSIDAIAAEWLQNNRQMMQFAYTRHHLCHFLRYEDLVRHPKPTLEALTQFLHLPFEKDMLQFYKFHDEPEATMDWKAETRNPLNETRIGQYAEVLTQKEIHLFEEKTQQLLVIGGYLKV